MNRKLTNDISVLKGKELEKCLWTATSDYFYRMLVTKSHLLWGPGSSQEPFISSFPTLSQIENRYGSKLEPGS